MCAASRRCCAGAQSVAHDTEVEVGMKMFSCSYVSQYCFHTDTSGTDFLSAGYRSSKHSTDTLAEYVCDAYYRAHFLFSGIILACHISYHLPIYICGDKIYLRVGSTVI